LTLGYGIRNGLKKIKIRIQDEHLDHVSESLETIFWVKILKIGTVLKFYDAVADLEIFLALDRDGKDLDLG